MIYLLWRVQIKKIDPSLSIWWFELQNDKQTANHIKRFGCAFWLCHLAGCRSEISIGPKKGYLTVEQGAIRDCACRSTLNSFCFAFLRLRCDKRSDKFWCWMQTCKGSCLCHVEGRCFCYTVRYQRSCAHNRATQAKYIPWYLLRLLSLCFDLVVSIGLCLPIGSCCLYIRSSLLCAPG